MRNLLSAVLMFIGLIILTFVLIVIDSPVTFPAGFCDFQGGWTIGTEPDLRTCSCYGYEHTIADDLMVDGPRSTACFGLGIRN